ncbi:hypothetical protein LX32DRAFT_668228 [Colletotrichum zoysiae]|uniref:Nephrocystin 3-like N-terminal domain-containing protein n=1 Tax=Colletotrichum zoysiae TaxID=1216348 RepID=A0AAD9H5D5_9PEZI|nr:hypothetical protein LX32DRAFT_668228 [Colletotrichum zoysiae]
MDPITAISLASNLCDSVIKLRNGIEVVSFSEVAKSQLQQLLQVPEREINVLAQQRILKSIAHQGMKSMNERYDMICEAHAKTFEWARRLARALFVKWLSSGEGVFHIAAKLGAGKSTMMKFMCSNEHVRALLETWARSCNRKLVFAKHFFYQTGASHQKSLAGMCRTLIHEVLESCPGLMPLVLPTYWAQVRSSPWQVGKKIHISDRAVLQAFNCIVEISRTSNEFRFCFFIDGLDELEDTIEFSHRDLVNLLNEWHRRSSGHIKISVSSREHNVFMNGFSSSQRICLHALTRRDLESFIHDKLMAIRDPIERNWIVGLILEKAHGVFFWVALAVHNTRRYLDDDRHPSIRDQRPFHLHS